MAEASSPEPALSSQLGELKDKAVKLIQQNQELRQAMATLLVSRRLYALALHEMDGYLHESLAAAEITENQLDELRAIFVESAANDAKAAFDSRDLLLGVRDTVGPWLQTTVRRHTDEEIKNKTEKYAEREKARRERPVALGVSLNGREPGEVRKGESVTLAGPSNVVRWTLQRLTREALSLAVRLESVLYLAAGPPPEYKDYRLQVVPVTAWKDQATSRKSWEEFWQFQLSRMDGTPDLLVVEDLFELRRGLTGARVAASATNSHKILKQHATRHGYALLAGLAWTELEARTEKLQQISYESLSLHTTLRLVARQVAADGSSSIVLGNNCQRFDDIQLAEFGRLDKKDR